MCSIREGGGRRGARRYHLELIDGEEVVVYDD